MPHLHELRKDRLQLAVGDLAVIDVQRAEVPAVHQVAQPGIGAAVRILRIGRQADRHLDTLGDLPEVGLHPFAQPLEPDPLAAQPLLLLVEQVRTDAVGVVRIEQLPLLRFQPRQRPFAVAQVLLADISQLLQAGDQLVTQHDPLLLGQRDALVEPLDCRFDITESVGRLRAVAMLAVDAHEVLIELVVPVDVAAVEQPRPALSAEQRPCQVVMVLPSPCTVLAARFQDFLHPLEQRL